MIFECPEGLPSISFFYQTEVHFIWAKKGERTQGVQAREQEDGGAKQKGEQRKKRKKSGCQEKKADSINCCSLNALEQKNKMNG